MLSYQVTMLQEAHMYTEDGLSAVYIPCMKIKYFEPYITIKTIETPIHPTVNTAFV